jgi:hypothetical protein
MLGCFITTILRVDYRIEVRVANVQFGRIDTNDWALYKLSVNLIAELI